VCVCVCVCVLCGLGGIGPSTQQSEVMAIAHCRHLGSWARVGAKYLVWACVFKSLAKMIPADDECSEWVMNGYQ
jgi:hypothetical protein